MENLFSNNMQRSRPSPHERWRTLYEQSISFQTFGIPVEPPYIDMDSIPAIAELNSEANNQAKQELLKVVVHVSDELVVSSELRVMWSR